MRYTILATSLALACDALGLVTESNPNPNPTINKTCFTPSHDIARERGFQVFNAIHSAMRQWGSSLHHNGLGLIPATVPRGTLLYHGTWRNYTPPDFEWLAFEMEHAENFASSTKDARKGPSKGPQPPQPPGQENRQKALGHQSGSNPNRGYLHTYRTNRDLRLLYIDGMSGGNTDMGTWTRRISCYETLIMPLHTTIGAVGTISAPCGLDLVSILRTPYQEDREGASIDLFEWVRAVSRRYDGIGAGRVTLEFGRMVSGLWYPVNVTNPDPTMIKHPRLIQATSEERAEILKRVEDVVSSTRQVNRVDWQSIADMIVSRYGERLTALAEEEQPAAFASQIYVVTNTFVDYPATSIDKSAIGATEKMTRQATQRCVRHFLEPALVWKDEWTDEDALIYTATRTVAKRICVDLFRIRSLLLDASPELAEKLATRPWSSVGTIPKRLFEAVREGKEIILLLMEKLDWASWRKCPGCSVGEVCFVPMWPFGLKEDYVHPSCMNQSRIDERSWYNSWGNDSYWRLDGAHWLDGR
ncbi:hypothetical protein CT0861_03860 [Colletotrichum tofieldiae]|uniref:Uncharacterized protein n=1 Tax=Colletotrichum tofieldiae TaxID=708197 RepID=A0A161VJE0_9PEZI|nr:hypothetical protein CT0861_03860 [Colletotrichum tofieldiae]